MTNKPKPYPKNVEGDFYVEDGCCLTCMVPEVYAPNLMSFDDKGAHCFFSKQPADDTEVYQAIKAAWAADLNCIRYGGKKLHILRRLAEAGVSEVCDHYQLIQGIKPLFRNHVTFDDAQISSEIGLAKDFKKYLSREDQRYKISHFTIDRMGTMFSFSWYGEYYYSIWFSKTEPVAMWHVFHSVKCEEIGSRSVSNTIDDWLRSRESVGNIRWYSDRAWNNSLPEWQETPI